jgi:electron transfer flavoprotein alpha subunit
VSDSVVAIVEHSDGTPTNLSLQLLTMARRLAIATGARLEALAIGPGAEAAASAAAAYGVTFLHLADDERLRAYAPEAWAHAITQLVELAHPIAILGPGSDRGAEVMAHVAARLKLPLATNCSDVTPGDPFLVTRQRWGGSLLEEARLKGEVKLLTVAAHAVAPEPAETPARIIVESRHPQLDDRDFRVRLEPQAQAETGRVSLARARVVVGGGRGVGSAEGFATLEELAALLHGAVGCSRAVTSLGWRPHSDQVGQTGMRIAPDLYIACGISGAIQHMVGCRAAKHILAINTDRDAPILAQADYAVIGDVKRVLASVIEEIHKLEPGR